MIVAAAVNDSSLADIVAYIGPSAVMKIYAGPVPPSCESSPDTLLARMALPYVWLSTAGKKVGEWREANADGTGIASYFRIYDSTETRCGMQGVAVTELRLDSAEFVAGEDFVVLRFTLRDQGSGLIACDAHGQSLFRRLIRGLCRDAGGVAEGLSRYSALLQDLKIMQDVPATRAEGILLEDGEPLTTEAGVPLLMEMAA